MNQSMCSSVRPLLFVCFGLVAIDAALAQQRPRNMPMPRQETPRPPVPLQPQASIARSSENEVSLSDSVRWAQRTNGGRVLGAERVQSDGRAINRIKMMDDTGHVSYVDDDRASRHHDSQRSQAPSGGRPAATP
jgi:hypothetical protein